jgi:hypothetical protein
MLWRSFEFDLTLQLQIHNITPTEGTSNVPDSNSKYSSNNPPTIADGTSAERKRQIAYSTHRTRPPKLTPRLAASSSKADCAGIKREERASERIRVRRTSRTTEIMMIMLETVSLTLARLIPDQYELLKLHIDPPRSFTVSHIRLNKSPSD